METLMLLTYAALCIVVFKVFRIPLNKWTVPTAVLGGIALIGAVIFDELQLPYTDVGNQVFRTVPIVSQVRGRVQTVPVKPNQRLHKGDVLFTLDPTPFQAKVDDLQAQIKAASQDALSLNAALSQAEAELSRAVAQRDQSRRSMPAFGRGMLRAPSPIKWSIPVCRRGKPMKPASARLRRTWFRRVTRWTRW